MREARQATVPFFMKPAEDSKVFGGTVVRSVADLASSAHLQGDFSVVLSEAVEIVSEYRCFILHQEVVGCRHYKGDPLSFPDRSAILEMVSAWPAAPHAFSLDVGINAKGNTIFIEANDGHSIGDYGLAPMTYARFLEARWCELTGDKAIA